MSQSCDRRCRRSGLPRSATAGQPLGPGAHAAENETHIGHAVKLAETDELAAGVVEHYGGVPRHPSWSHRRCLSEGCAPRGWTGRASGGRTPRSPDWNLVAFHSDILGDIESLTCGTYITWVPHVSDLMLPRMSPWTVTESASGDAQECGSGTGDQTVVNGSH